MSGYSIVRADDVEDPYADSDVPGEFRKLTDALGADQVAVTRGALTMRFGDAIEVVEAGSVARVAPGTTRSHRNEGDEPVEMWAVSRQLDRQDATKVEDFWEPSESAAQER